MNIHPDDPKWTAYVLGELDADERAEIERLVESSEEARTLVEELRVAAGMLRDELASQSGRAPALLAEQRAGVLAASAGASAPAR